MSYILDALKKADRNRRAVAVPTLGTMHRASEPARRRTRWAWIAAALIAVNAGVWIWLLRPVGPAKDFRSTAATPAPAPQTQPLEQASAPAAERVPRPPDQKTRAEMPVVPATPPPIPTRSPALPTTSPPSPAAALTQARPENVRAATKPAESKPSTPPVAAPPAPSARVATPAATPVPPASPSGEKTRGASAPTAGSAAAGVAGGVAGVQAPGAAPPTNPVVQQEKSLAPPVAPAAPAAAKTPEPTPTPPESGPPDPAGKLSLQMLVFSAVPSERLVFINNQKYVEGQRIDDSTVVESITPDGAVLSYQGRRFVLRSDQNSSR